MKKDPTIKATNSEQESYYEEALNEMNSGERRPGIYAKAIADSMGDEKKVDSLYLKYRAQSIMEEAKRIESKKIEAERIEAERIAEEERLEVERLEAERLEAERIAELERLEAERLEAERLEAERLEAERLEAEILEAERIAEEARKLNNQMDFTDLIRYFVFMIFIIFIIAFFVFAYSII
jgi:hypothetical protein